MKNKTSRMLASNWFITLSATLLAVFGALFLNEWVSSKKVGNQKIIATKNIKRELTANQKNLEISIKEHTELLEIFEFLNKYSNNDDTLITQVDSMNTFRTKYPEVIKVSDSTLLENGKYEYVGQVNLDLSLPQIQFTTIAWETLKNSGISSSYDFDCLMYLETIDKVTAKVLQKDNVLLEYLTGQRDVGPNNEYLVDHLKLLIEFEKSLRETYLPKDEKLKNCG